MAVSTRPSRTAPSASARTESRISDTVFLPIGPEPRLSTRKSAGGGPRGVVSVNDRPSLDRCPPGGVGSPCERTPVVWVRTSRQWGCRVPGSAPHVGDPSSTPLADRRAAPAGMHRRWRHTQGVADRAAGIAGAGAGADRPLLVAAARPHPPGLSLPISRTQAMERTRPPGEVPVLDVAARVENHRRHALGRGRDRSRACSWSRGRRQAGSTLPPAMSLSGAGPAPEHCR
jgi:hypothetical protein